MNDLDLGEFLKSLGVREPAEGDLDPINISVMGTSKGYLLVKWDKPREMVAFSTPEKARIFASVVTATANQLEEKLKKTPEEG